MLQILMLIRSHGDVCRTQLAQIIADDNEIVNVYKMLRNIISFHTVVGIIIGVTITSVLKLIILIILQPFDSHVPVQSCLSILCGCLLEHSVRIDYRQCSQIPGTYGNIWLLRKKKNFTSVVTLTMHCKMEADTPWSD